MKMTRNIHWISLAISLFVLIHRLILGGRFPEWLLFGLPLTALSVSAACGIAMIRNHRSDERLLPPVEYVTYGVAALAWSWFVMAFAHDVANMGHRAYWVAVVLPWLMFAGPWLAFRRHQPPPMVIDAALIMTAVVLAHAVTTSLRSLPSVEWLASYGYLVLPSPIAATAWFLHRLKKAGVSELWAAIGCGGALLLVAWMLLPTLS